MSRRWPAIRKRYVTALREYVATPDETNLSRAYELGRELVGEAASILDVSTVYHQELARLLRAASTPQNARRALARARSFFGESLSPIAMAQGGFQDTVDRLRDLRQMLEFQQAISGATRMADAIASIVAHAALPLGAGSCVLLRPTADGSWEREGPPGDEQRQRPLSNVERRLVKLALQKPRPVVLDMAGDNAGVDDGSGDPRSLLAVALRSGEATLGVLLFEARTAFGPAEVTLAQLVAETATQAIRRAELLEQYAETRGSELALRETNHRMEEFLSVAGHELRTPLTSVLGNVQLIARWIAELNQGVQGLPDPPDQPLSLRLAQLGKALQRADRQGHILVQLVNDFLDVSRIQAGQLALRLAPCDLAALVRGCVEEHQPILARRGMQLDLPEEPVHVIADEGRVGQVLTNYLANALKFAPPTQPIVVGLRVEGDDARVWVSDEGPGIALAEQAHIWQRFYRVPGVQYVDGSSVGLGLGLHLCQSIIERHGGRVGVDSSPGAGATFWFLLPVAGQQRSGSEEPWAASRAVEKETPVL